ncbi:hypothetical protein [Salinisphaera sp. LB1]|nr:hypothetical protein [Salinisphaera sp. LB1]AWN17852.1 hypothetical protein SALB1_3660 [Salinisphaera sp. LB1]
MYDLVTVIADGNDCYSNFAFGAHHQRILEAIDERCRAGRWITV